MPLNQSFTNISSLPKNTSQICLILHMVNLYVLLVCGKKLVTIELVSGVIHIFIHFMLYLSSLLRGLPCE